jgi:VWFA-related protein
LALCLVLASDVHAQAPAAGNTTFTSRSELVTIPVIVTNKSGAHIPGLKKEDFAVQEDGRLQTIAVFEEIQKPPKPPQRPPTPPNVFSNVLPGNTVPRQLIILVLDLINTPFAEQAKARHALLQFLQESLDQGQLTSLLVVTPRQVKVVRDFTADPTQLVAALKKVNAIQPMVNLTSHLDTLDDSSSSGTPQTPGDLEDFAQGKQDEALEAMENFEIRVAIQETTDRLGEIARAYGGLPGRKALVWASAGFPFSVSQPAVFRRGRRQRVSTYTMQDVLPYYEKAWTELNDAQIALYPVDLRGLTNPGFGDLRKMITNPNQSYVASQQWLDQETISTFRNFANETGGVAFYRTNDLKGAFEQSAEDNTSYYMLGYYLDRKGKKPGWHKLTVKPYKPDFEIRARNGFFLTEPMNDPVKTAQLDIQTALGAPLDYTAIPITARWDQIRPATEAGKKNAIFLLSMGPNFAMVDDNDHSHLLVDIAAAALTGSGASAGVTSQTIDDHLKPEGAQQLKNIGMGFKGVLTVAPGDYTVRFVVRDRLTGRIGSVAAPLKIAP